MRNFMNKISLVFIGIIAGVMVSLNFSAIADKEIKEELQTLLIEELRTFSQVFGRIKSDYVEPVEDKKLITEAINGMLVGLDPHSAFLITKNIKNCKLARKVNLADWGSR